MASVPIKVIVNGTRHERQAEHRRLLSDFLREDLGLKGVKISCDIGVCGACTVVMGKQTVRSCLLLAVQADGEELRTVEGLASGSNLHVLQEAFWDCHAIQCGYCTSGMLMTAWHLLEENPDPSDAEIRETISGNLCRCTGYVHIIHAIRLAAERMKMAKESGP